MSNSRNFNSNIPVKRNILVLEKSPLFLSIKPILMISSLSTNFRQRLAQCVLFFCSLSAQSNSELILRFQILKKKLYLKNHKNHNRSQIEQIEGPDHKHRLSQTVGYRLPDTSHPNQETRLRQRAKIRYQKFLIIKILLRFSFRLSEEIISVNNVIKTPSNIFEKSFLNNGILEF